MEDQLGHARARFFAFCCVDDDAVDRGDEHRRAAPRPVDAHLGRAVERQGATAAHLGARRMSTLERLQALLERDFQLGPPALVAEATLERLDIDSLRMIEILFSIEDEFKIAMPAEQAQIRERVKTLGYLAGNIVALISGPEREHA